MPSLVVIDVPAEARAAAAVAVSRCEQVLGGGRCRLSAAEPGLQATTYYANVMVEGPDGASVTIVFRRDATAVLAERKLAFSSADALESRWASIGLVVASLVTTFDARVPEKALPAPKPPAPAPAPAPPVLGFDVGVLSGPGLDAGQYRWGGLLRGWYGLPPNPRVVTLLGLRYAARFSEPRVNWASLSLGLGTRSGSRDARLRLELSGELVGERVMVWAEEASGRSDSAAQWRFGGRLGTNVGLRVAAPLSVVLGAEAAAMTPAVRVLVHDQSVGREPAARFDAWLGLRWSL